MKPTNLQRIILVIYAIAIVSICIFFAPKSIFDTNNGVSVILPIERSPIWRKTYNIVEDQEATSKAIEKDMEARGYHEADYNYSLERLLDYYNNVPPEDIPKVYKTEINPYVRVDYYRMAIEIFAITVVAGILYIIVMPKKEG